MNYTFNNSSIVSVNSGTIILNVAGKTRTFVDAKLVSVVNGDIVLDLPSFKLLRGAYVTVHLNYDPRIQRTFISSTDDTSFVTYHVTQFDNGIKFVGSWGIHCLLRNATPEEIKELNAQLAAKGKHWNPDTMQIEKLRWQPQYGDNYYRIFFDLGKWTILKEWWSNVTIDINCWKENNCFKTKEEAEAKLKQIKKLLLEV